ncbi:hypothetical protein Y032_0106g3759 [Ancylostoma ceylanicum]|uniref:Uncharacterized protein n=1 Tax=Ancylostoma ceylanicum TaxID=53326 RepID=A0A016TFV1_9BILA|nr:hypothetical protein Y032_0106g3759 [Ancylostoma ceylanicum]
MSTGGSIVYKYDYGSTNESKLVSVMTFRVYYLIYIKVKCCIYCTCIIRGSVNEAFAFVGFALHITLLQDYPA